jgi:hypothetical protein
MIIADIGWHAGRGNPAVPRHVGTGLSRPEAAHYSGAPLAVNVLPARVPLGSSHWPRDLLRWAERSGRRRRRYRERAHGLLLRTLASPPLAPYQGGAGDREVPARETVKEICCEAVRGSRRAPAVP